MSNKTGQTRVLVVEDEQNLADLFEVWLTEMYKVETAYSGEAALERVAEHGADIMLLDRRMPGLSGDEVARRLNQAEHDVQIIMITAVSPSPDMATLPIDNYLTKPVEKRELFDIVETADLVSEYDKEITKLLALLNRRHVLEREVPEDELENSKQFDRLGTQITELKESVDDRMDELLQHPDIDAFRRIEST